MNHRDRVLAAINHKEPDRVPIDLWGSASRIHNKLYYKIIKEAGLEGKGDLVRPGKSTAYVDYRISDLIDSDFRHTVVGRNLKYFKSYKDKNGNIIDEWGVGRKYVDEYLMATYFPLADATVNDINNYKWPIPEDPGRIEGIEDKARYWYENTDYSITATTAVSGIMFELGQYLRGPEQFFVDLFLNQKFAHKLINKIAEISTQIYVYYLKPIGKYIDWVEFTEDFGMQDSPFISIKTFKKFFSKPHKKMFEAIKKTAPKAKIFFHTCGSVRELIPCFIDIGVEILNPMQPSAKDMDSFEIKKEFGKELVFHGGVDIQHEICRTKKRAINEAKKRIKAFAPGGGYIFAPTNHFQPDTSVENFFEIYKTAREYGTYPIRIDELKYD